MADHMALELTEAITHEYQHQHQYRSRGFMLNRGYVSKVCNGDLQFLQEYYGSPDEIDAYATNIAVRFYLLELLNTAKPYASFDLSCYYETFGFNHPIIKRLLKKIHLNITYLRENNSTQARKKYIGKKIARRSKQYDAM